MNHPRCSPMLAALVLGSTALTVACSEESDQRYFGAGGAPLGEGGTEPSDTIDTGGASAGAGGVGASGGQGGVAPTGGNGGAEPPGPSDPQVCYPGPTGDYSACVPLVPWSAAWGAEYSYPSHASPQYAKPQRFVDLSTADPSLAIAANFALEEVMQAYKGRYAVFQPHVVEKLQTIRDTIGGALHLNSAYRSPGYNVSIAGATYSRHMYGDAADMWSNAVSLTGLSNICSDLGAGYIGMYASFVHCDWRDDPLEPAFYSNLPPATSLPVARPVHTGELVRAGDGSAWLAPATGFDEGEPLRLWTAFDEAGRVIDRAEGEQYEPPSGAARLHVQVGGQLELEIGLDD
jgi:hypothetical protein